MEKDDDDGDGNEEEEEEQMNTVLLLLPHKDSRFLPGPKVQLAERVNCYNTGCRE